MTEIIGKVLDKATPNGFLFVSTKYFNAKFVEIRADHISNGSKIIGEIIEREALNPYFERPTDVTEI